MAEKDLKDSLNINSENAENDLEQPGFDLNTDENQRGTTHLGDSLQNEPELEKLKAEIAEGKDKYVRLMAEFENFKRRSRQERLEILQTAGKEVIVQMLDVLDDADRAQKQLNTTDDVKLIREGVSLVFNKLRNSLQSKGLRPMESIGKDFDVDLHEAITEIPAASDEMKGKVIDEVMKGYYLNDKLIRHAKVVVGK